MKTQDINGPRMEKKSSSTRVDRTLLSDLGGMDPCTVAAAGRARVLKHPEEVCSNNRSCNHDPMSPHLRNRISELGKCFLG